MKDFSNIDQQLSTWIDDHADELLLSTQGLLRIPSVTGPAAPGAPFGAETARALEFALGVAEGHGLKVKNLDGYAGHVEWRPEDAETDSEIVGVLAHVDVVPEGDGWVHPAFGAEVDEGIIYARGAVDDKGPAMAGLYAVLALAGCNVPGKRRVRLILGTDEECNFGCVHHYFANEEMPATGFTPDGRFPVVFAEKGIANLEIGLERQLKVGNLNVVSMAAGLRSNMVPDLGQMVVEGTQEDIYRLSSALPVDAVEIGAGHTRLTITARGVSAHGSMPENGVNAVAVLIDMVRKTRVALDPIWDILEIWAKDTTGSMLGIQAVDDIAGPLTTNLGMIAYKEGRIKVTFNIRYLVTWSIEDVLAKINPALDKVGARLTSHTDLKPLYVPVDDPLLTTLLEVYRDETGDMRAPLSVGGGTYARVMKKGVAFGPEFQGPLGGAHQPDEHWPVDHMIRACKIYARALARLAAQ